MQAKIFVLGMFPQAFLKIFVGEALAANNRQVRKIQATDKHSYLFTP
jgi:hypothetical protein